WTPGRTSQSRGNGSTNCCRKSSDSPPTKGRRPAKISDSNKPAPKTASPPAAEPRQWLDQLLPQELRFATYEGPPPCEHLEQHQTCGVHVAARVHRFSGGLLGRSVCRCSAGLAHPGACWR